MSNTINYNCRLSIALQQMGYSVREVEKLLKKERKMQSKIRTARNTQRKQIPWVLQKSQELCEYS